MVIPAPEGSTSVQLCRESHHLISAVQKRAAGGLSPFEPHTAFFLQSSAAFYGKITSAPLNLQLFSGFISAVSFYNQTSGK